MLPRRHLIVIHCIATTESFLAKVMLKSPRIPLREISVAWPLPFQLIATQTSGHEYASNFRMASDDQRRAGRRFVMHIECGHA